MQKLFSLFMTMAVLLCGSIASVAETNQAATNTVSSGATNQAVALNASDPELQAQAKGVLWMVLVFRSSRLLELWWSRGFRFMALTRSLAQVEWRSWW
jgi:hypothetical protein